MRLYQGDGRRTEEEKEKKKKKKKKKKKINDNKLMTEEIANNDAINNDV